MISHDTLAVFDMDGPRGHVVLRMHGYADLQLARRDQLAGARQDIDWILERFRADIAVARPRLPALQRALTRLTGELDQRALLLVNDNTNLLDEIRVRFTERWPGWRHSDVVPVVEVRGHDDQFPFELLPLLDATPFHDYVNLDEVAGGLRRFLGFSAAVHRIGPYVRESTPLRGSGGLPVQLITYDMDGANAESAAFGLRGDTLRVDGPWPPADLTQDDVEERLLDALYDATVLLADGTRAEQPVQIQHFAVHCLTGDLTASGYTLLLGGPKERRRPVSLGTIKSGQRLRVQRRGAHSDPRPLVVVNACGSAKLDLKMRQSFPNWFLNNQHRGFVGTEVDVPDPVAAVFTEELYGALLSGAALGEAVVRARRRLLTRWHNPLGLLYACYGDPALTVETR